jgi:hypothetical protein
MNNMLCPLLIKNESVLFERAKSLCARTVQTAFKRPIHMTVLSFRCFLRYLLRVYDHLLHSLYTVSSTLIFCVIAVL